MKANEFVKKFGWGDAKKTSNPKYETINKELYYCVRIEDYTDGLDDYEPCPDCVNIADLKCFVESHELVKKHNGLESAKHDLYTAKKVGMYIIWGTSIDLLRQAIADVESCQ